MPDGGTTPPRLRAIEKQLIANAASGTWTGWRGEEPSSEETMRSWKAARTVRASVLRCLLAEDTWPVHPKGVLLAGVRIDGPLNLDFATVRCPLWLHDCFLADPAPVSLIGASIARLAITNSRLSGIAGEGVVVRNGLSLRRSTLAGRLALPNADIGGVLNANGAMWTGPATEVSIFGDGLTVGADLILRRAAVAGGIRLAGASVTGDLTLTDARLHGPGPDGYSLVLDRARVGGVMFMKGECSCAGSLRMYGAILSGLEGAARIEGADSDGDALVADLITIHGPVFLSDHFTAAGAVRLHGAEIVGPLELRDATLGANNDGMSLVGTGVRVHGDAFLDGEFRAAGSVLLRGARMDGSLELNGAALDGAVALNAEEIQIGQRLAWAPREPVAGIVNLERGSAHRVVDDWDLPNGHWPTGGRLRLTGFTYDGFGPEATISRENRLAWIRSQHPPGKGATFAAQPYEQLVRVLRAAGQEQDAIEVAIAARNDRRTYSTLRRRERLRSWFFDKTIKHGYRPRRALIILAGVYLATFVLALTAQHRGDTMVATRAPTHALPREAARNCTPRYPCFYPVGYALDVVVPVLDVGQADAWRPDGHASWGWAFVGATWLFTALGWAFSTLAVLGFTGVIRKE